MKVDWKPGPPTEPGMYWVMDINAERPYVMRASGDPKYWSYVTHHAPAEVPDPPREKPEPGWYRVRDGSSKKARFREVRGDSDLLYDDAGYTCARWQTYEFGPRLPDPPKGWE